MVVYKEYNARVFAFDSCFHFRFTLSTFFSRSTIMMKADPSLTVLTTEQIQKWLEENEELIMAILEGQKQGKHGELAPYQAKLQHNLTFAFQMNE